MWEAAAVSANCARAAEPAPSDRLRVLARRIERLAVAGRVELDDLAGALAGRVAVHLGDGEDVREERLRAQRVARVPERFGLGLVRARKAAVIRILEIRE